MQYRYFQQKDKRIVCLIFACIMPYRSIFQTILLIATICLSSCTAYEEPDSGIDCGRQFIQATYQGNFKRAKQLLVPTDENNRLLEENIEKSFRTRNSAEKENLSNASITINHLESKGDSVQLIHFTSAYNGKDQILKCVQWQGKWKTDLAFSFRK